MSVGTRLAVVDTTTVCDGPGQHDIRVITDGLVCYAYGLGHQGVDCGPATRTADQITVTCHQSMGRHADACDGIATARLTDAGAWSGATEPLALLEQYGEVVDR